jgi:UDP-N-acetylglucosamine 2-epimerase (non-hydrolysing)
MRLLARQMLRSGQVDDPVLGRLDLTSDHLWRSTDDRMALRRLHGLLFLADWLPAVPGLDPAEIAGLSRSVERVVTLWRAVSADADQAPSAYHDETTAQRFMVLLGAASYLGDVDSRHACGDVLQSDLARLLDPGFHAGRNNHGMLQDIALLAGAVLGPLDSETKAQAWATGWDRFSDYVRHAYTRDGVLAEHTPAYHLMVTRSVRRVSALARVVADQGRFDAPGLEALDEGLRGAERFAVHLVTPQGTYPRISDTKTQALARPGSLEAFPSSQFRFAATGGREGEAPDERAVVFPDAGYAVFRSAWGNPDADFVLFLAAYNGSFHKHSDELSLMVRHRGRDLLHEAGPNGYNYSDPFTRYAFSSFAHNTLIVDGEGLPRHDGKLAATWLEDLGTDSTGLRVRGVTTRYPGVEFERVVEVEPAGNGTWIRVTDTIAGTSRHDYTLLWHVGPGVTPNVDRQSVLLESDGTTVGRITLDSATRVTLRAVRAGDDANLVGWYFPEMGRPTPASAVMAEFTAARAQLVWTIRTGGPDDWATAAPTVPLVFVVQGTRPEVIKCAPLVRALTDHPGVRCAVVSTGQHPDLAGSTDDGPDVVVRHDLDVFEDGQGPGGVAAKTLQGVTRLIRADHPSAVVVQGDTASAMGAAWAAFYERVPVVHLEAGLRTPTLDAPHPEEGHRRALSQIASLHLAPAAAQQANLLAAGVPADSIAVVGNTGIDALLRAVATPHDFNNPVVRDLARGASDLALVTAHRRESWGVPIQNIALAIRRLAELHPAIDWVFPVHVNPIVSTVVRQVLDGIPRVHLTDPLSYLDTAHLLTRARLVVTDSGGLQEEAPALGVPVVIVRRETERMEIVEAGAGRLVGTDADNIVAAASALLAEDPRPVTPPCRPYGTGQAALRATVAIQRFLASRTGPSDPVPHPGQPETGETIDE